MGRKRKTVSESECGFSNFSVFLGLVSVFDCAVRK